MSGALLLGLIGALHLGLLVAAFTSPAARLAGGLAAIALNYGLRRLLFLDPALGASQGAWLGLILLGDLTLVLIVAMSAARPAGRPTVTATDLAVAGVALVTVALALADGRLPAVVRLAHWKEEYLALAAYALARLNGPAAAARPGALAAVAVAAVGVVLWQAVVGPLPIDIAWVRSGHSVLTAGGAAEIVGAHGLGNLEAGFLRPYGLFGNGTDCGVFLAFVGLWAVAARLPAGGAGARALARAALRPLPLLCALGLLLTVVRFTWLVGALGLLLLALGTARGGAARGLRLWVLGTALAAGAGGFLLLAPLVGGSGSLVERAFVTGTWADRADSHAAVRDRVQADPAILLIGEGFGANGAAARKFLPAPETPRVEPHSRVLDLLLDGGLPLVAVVLAPLALALGGGGAGDPVRAAMLAFAGAFLLGAALVGAKSMLLQTLVWAALGIAVTRRAAAPAPRTAEAPA